MWWLTEKIDENWGKKYDKNWGKWELMKWEGANWPLAVDGRCSDEWADAVIIQICNVYVGNCWQIIQIFTSEIDQICIPCRTYKYAMYVWENCSQIIQIFTWELD